MAKAYLDNWCIDIQPLTGILYFAQRWDEMLFAYSIDSHRYRLFNVPALCTELLIVYDLCKINVLPWKSLLSIRDELVEILGIDTISQEILGYKYSDLKKTLNEWDCKSSKNDSIAYAASVILKLTNADLHSHLLAELTEVITEPKKKQKIDSLSSQLLTETIRLGYSEHFLYKKIKEHFFSERTVKNKEDFIAFFKDLTGEHHNYSAIVVAPDQHKVLTEDANPKFIAHKDDFEFRLNNQDESFFESTRGKKQTFLVFENIDATDPDSARASALDRLKLITSFVGFLLHKFKVFTPRFVLVYKEKDELTSHITRSPIKPTMKRPDVTSKEVKNSLMELISPFLNKDIEESTRERLSGFLRAHSAGTNANTAEDQFTNLWISFETLACTPLSETIIDTILDRSTPVLCLKYFQKLLNSLHSDLKRCFKKNYLKIIDSIRSDNSEIEACLDLLVNDAYKDTHRYQLYVLCELNPLMMQRIFRFRELFTDAKSSYKLLKQHEKRVKWHIRRMYRFRNALVHSGQSREMFIKPLVENLHAYVDQIFSEVLDRLNLEPHHFNLDKVYYEYQIDYSSYKTNLENLALLKPSPLHASKIVFGE